MSALDDIKKFRLLLEDSQSSTGNTSLDNGQDMSSSEPNHADDSKKIALISNFSRNLNPQNAQHSTDALTSMYKGTRPSSNQVQALVEIVANVFRACEANPSLIGTIKSNMKRQAQQK